MDILITICARGGSKGVPNKNIKPLNGIPLLHYSLKHAQELARRLPGHTDIELSTDSTQILACAQEMQVVTEYKRSKELAEDNIGKIDAIKHLWGWSERKRAKAYDYVIDLDVSSPLRTITDIEQALDGLRSKEGALNIFSVNPAAKNPYFNMVEIDETGYYQVVKHKKQVLSRQEAPKVYDMNASFYIFTREYMKGDYSTSTTERSLAYVMDHVCFDIDEPLDFIIMEFLVKEDLLGFAL